MRGSAPFASGAARSSAETNGSERIERPRDGRGRQEDDEPDSRPFEGADREPRRDRGSDRAHPRPPGNRLGPRDPRRGQGEPGRSRRRRSLSDRRRDAGRRLPRRGTDDRDRPADRRRRDPSRLRVPVGERRFRRGRHGCRHPLDRPVAEIDAAARRQDRGAPIRGGARRPADAIGQRGGRSR